MIIDRLEEGKSLFLFVWLVKSLSASCSTLEKFEMLLGDALCNAWVYWVS